MPLDFDAFPMMAIRKSRQLAWDPFEIDLTQDRQDWLTLTPDEQDLLLRNISGFRIGERAVTHDLAPLQQVLRKEKGRMAEEMYLTVQLFEESRHVEFFERWIIKCLPGTFGQDIPFPALDDDGRSLDENLTVRMGRVLRALTDDPSPQAQLRAVVIYHMIIEGVVAETGYRLFDAALNERNILPGLRNGIELIQRDETRHVAFGTYLLRRMIAERPELKSDFESEMRSLRPASLQGVDQVVVSPQGRSPFGINAADFHDVNLKLFQNRINAVNAPAAPMWKT